MWRVWDGAARRQVVAARRLLGHSQTDLGRALPEFGAPAVSQPVVSSWETGKTARPDEVYIAALRRYCEQVEDSLSPMDASEAPSSESTFSSLYRGITEEPLLGDLQRELVLGLIHRLKVGPALSAEDASTRDLLREILRLRLEPSNG